MASLRRSGARSGMRSMAALRNQNLNSKPFSPPVESMMPLHIAIANSRLKSSIVVDSSCWSWMSQGTTYLYLSL
ncbi:hypothetical protein MKW92_051378 [Papaver armeniacum]|nr:hypothetical protein MKW92_051378 [Papaver armeniacum]